MKLLDKKVKKELIKKFYEVYTLGYDMAFQGQVKKSFKEFKEAFESKIPKE